MFPSKVSCDSKRFGIPVLQGNIQRIDLTVFFRGSRKSEDRRHDFQDSVPAIRDWVIESHKFLAAQEILTFLSHDIAARSDESSFTDWMMTVASDFVCDFRSSS